MKTGRLLFFLLIIMSVVSGCDLDEILNYKIKFQLPILVDSRSDSQPNEHSFDSSGVDDVRIDEFRKDGKLARFFCNNKTGIIKLKVGYGANPVNNIDSGENIKKAMEMPESDYIHLGGGMAEMVVTIVTSEKGHLLSIQGINLFIVGSQDTPEQLNTQKNVDFFYYPCSYLSMEEEKGDEPTETANHRALDPEKYRAVYGEDPDSDGSVDNGINILQPTLDSNSVATENATNDAVTPENTQVDTNGDDVVKSKKSSKKSKTSKQKSIKTKNSRKQDPMIDLQF